MICNIKVRSWAADITLPYTEFSEIMASVAKIIQQKKPGTTGFQKQKDMEMDEDRRQANNIP